MTNIIIYEDYDPDYYGFGASYKQMEAIENRYGDRLIYLEEVRDRFGYLKQFKITLRRE